jgi:hypothetical protein
MPFIPNGHARFEENLISAYQIYTSEKDDVPRNYRKKTAVRDKDGEQIAKRRQGEAASAP